ncbi:hypothetical protein ACFLVS_01255 [Chloroflexota bacterium]
MTPFMVTTGLTTPFGIALDIAGGKMYWTDAGTQKIQRSNLNGSGVEDLVTTGLGDPFGISLDLSQVVDCGPTVGGDVYPVNKISLLIPWIVLTLAIAVAGILLVRRRAFGSK